MTFFFTFVGYKNPTFRSIECFQKWRTCGVYWNVRYRPSTEDSPQRILSLENFSIGFFGGSIGLQNFLLDNCKKQKVRLVRLIIRLQHAAMIWDTSKIARRLVEENSFGNWKIALTWRECNLNGLISCNVSKWPTAAHRRKRKDALIPPDSQVKPSNTAMNYKSHRLFSRRKIQSPQSQFTERDLKMMREKFCNIMGT